MKERSIQCLNIVALFFISTVMCEAASDSTTTSQVVNTGTIASPVIVHQGKTNTLSSTGSTIGAATDTAGNVAASCPAGSVYRDVSFSDQRVYLYDPAGAPSCGWQTVPQSPRDHVCTASEIGWDGEYGTCYCPALPNSCCISPTNCNYYEYQSTGQQWVCTSSGSGSWQSRSALPSGSNSNAPSVFSGGTCTALGWSSSP